MRVCGVVILYNPKSLQEIAQNILSYVDCLEKLFIVDNSESCDSSSIFALITKLSQNYNIQYIKNTENLGIAQPLNTACKLALEQGYTHILTMDQDSRFPDTKAVLKLSKVFNKQQNIGIVSPHHLIQTDKNNYEKKSTFNVEIKHVDSVWMSGNVVCLRAWSDVKGYNEDFFIDSVDGDFCNKLILKGFSILQASNIYLEHKLGNIKKFKFLFIRATCMNHSAVRKYYITRNKLYMAKKYGKHFPKMMRRAIKEISGDFRKVLFFENNKVKKLHYILWGIYDFFKNKTGKNNNLK